MADEGKRCPECAEMVLAAARKCRYCGYRFDHTSPLSRGSLGDLLRRAPATTSLRDLLSRWGTEIATNETIAYFGHCRLDGRGGYLLVSSARVAFYAGRGDDRLIDWPRGEVRAIERRRRFGGRGLDLSGPGATVTLDGFQSRPAFAEVLAELRPQDSEV